MSEFQQIPGGGGKKSLTVALFSANEERRREVAAALSAQTGVRAREFATLPSSREVAELLQQYRAMIVDADGDPNRAFTLIERLVEDGRPYVIAFSARSDMKTTLRFMRAGVREFLTLPLDMAEFAAAMTRAAAYHGTAQAVPRTESKLFTFLGTKGGCGVTTLAANFALALAQESEQKTLLIDFGQPLGDVAINLGMRNQYSVANALQEAERLDANFLSSLVAKHDAGLDVLAAPNEFQEAPISQQAVDRLAAAASQNYAYVVVDAGSRVDLIHSALFEQASMIYLVTQVGISELRNCHRMIAQFFAGRQQGIQIVLNRYTQKSLLFDDAQIAKTLSRPPKWKIPNDWAAAWRTRNSATPMVMVDSVLSEAIREMARDAAGLTADRGRRGIFGLLR